VRILSKRKSIGGVCQWCRRMLTRNQTIYRVADGRPRAWTVKRYGEGGTTAGSWVCLECAHLAQQQEPLPFEDAP